MIKLIIFDWDDVIILGSKEGYYNCYRETLIQLGVKLEESEFDRRIKKRWGQPFREELKELLIENPNLLDRACNIFNQEKFLGDTFTNSLMEVEGVNSLLNTLQSNYLLAVATGNTKSMVEDVIIPKFNIPKVFSHIISSHEIPNNKSKPDPYMIRFILEKLSVSPKDACYVGDAENDVKMAMNAQVIPIVVLTGHLDEPHAKALGATHIIPDVTHIESILNRL